MMLRCMVCCALVLSSVAGRAAERVEISPKTDWPWWRGPDRNGIADPDQNPPLTWDDSHNVLWKAPVPGKGHGSPIVVGNRVYITAADKDVEQQIVLCFARASGDELWRTVIHEGGFPTKGNEKSTLASSTPASDGQHVFVNFLNDGAVWTTALDLDGNRIWQQKISDYIIHQGYGSSPAIYGPLVIVSADNKSGGMIMGLDRATGDIVWQRNRPEKPNYPSPIILHVAGRDQLLMTGCDLVTSLDPLSGEELWEIEGATTECVTSTVTDGKHVFTSGGYPDNHMAAVAADGSGRIVWENSIRTYVPSMLVSDGLLFAVHDGGVASCRTAGTGEELWKGRLSGTFSSSPILVGNRIYVTSEEGTTFVIEATAGRFSLLAQNKLGDEVFATPVICDSRIYNRMATDIDGKRQEYLYCIGTKSGD